MPADSLLAAHSNIAMKNRPKQFRSHKIVIVGDQKVGKTSLIARFADNFFREPYVATIGIDYKCRTVQLNNGERLRLEIFDTAGLERFRPIASAYYQNASGVVIVYDVNNLASFTSVEKYYRELKYFIPPDTEVIVVGTQSDRSVEDRCVSFETADALTARLGLSLFETSSLTGENVAAAFQEIAERLRDKTTAGTYGNENVEDRMVLDSAELTAKPWCISVPVWLCGRT